MSAIRGLTQGGERSDPLPLLPAPLPLHRPFLPTCRVGKGLVGAAIRPTAGVAKLTHRWAGALQQATGESEANSTHSARVGRVRPPRMLHGLGKRIAPYSIAEALARHVLLSTVAPPLFSLVARGVV